MEEFRIFILPLLKFGLGIVILYFLFKWIWPVLEVRVTNRLFRKNIQSFLVVQSMVILFFLLLGEQFSNIYKDIISIEIKLLLIALLFVNISHRIEARDSAKGKPLWITQSRLFVIGIISTLSGALAANVVMHEFVGESYYWEGGFFGLQTLELAVIMITSLTFLLLWLLYRSREQESKEKLKLKELELVKMSELKKTAELEALQSKVNPHFLYNSLSVISALIKESPDKAEKMTSALSRLFRYNINKENDAYSTVREELEIVKTFLEIEKYRFEEKLEIKYSIQESCESKKIPRFLLQPLVENSIKHGISREIGKGEIEIEISSVKDTLWIRIYDSGPPFKDTNSQAGYGIKGSLDKLELLYPDNYSFELKNGERKHVEIQIRKG